MRVAELAQQLEVDARSLRSFLRSKYGLVGKGKRWELSAEQVEQAKGHFEPGDKPRLRLAFLGGGVMAEAMVAGVLSRNLTKPLDIAVSDISPARLSHHQTRYGVQVYAENLRAAEQGEVVVLAIKPQNLEEVLQDLKGKLQPHQVVLSIVAGGRIATMAKGLGHRAIVRSMPNTPGQIGQGITVWTATPEVTAAQKEKVKAILSCLGKEVYVLKEGYVDMATAVNGSGPAYVFLFLEALIEGAVHIGLPRDTAREVVLETVLGSVLLAQRSGKHTAELRDLVTSPGGTTAEGLLQLDEGGFRALLAHAIIAAYEKSRSLGG